MTGPITTALANLAALTVPGISNTGVDALPGNITRAALPALLVLPTENTADRLFGERGTAFPAVAFSSGVRTFTVTVTHLLLAAPAAEGSAPLPGLIAHVDNYLTALSADLTLSDALAEPAQVRVEIGAFTHGGTPYHGCAFRHTWTLEVTP